MVGVRLDSGDLAYLSIEARRLLNEAGFPDAAIVASNDLDENLIASLIFGFTDLFLFPFTGLINSPTTGNMVLELSSLFAIIIYGLIAWGFGESVWLIFYRPRGPVLDVTETTTSEPPL